jgi:hypothetical protein
VVVPAVAGGGSGVVQCVTPAVDVDGMIHIRPSLIFHVSLAHFIDVYDKLSYPFNSPHPNPFIYFHPFSFHFTFFLSSLSPPQVHFLCTFYITTTPGFPPRMISSSTSTLYLLKKAW